MIQPSARTQGLWTTLARHAIRIELVVLIFGILSVILAGAQIGIAHDPYSGVPIWNLPVPLLSIIVSAVDIYLFSRKCLHPVYSVCVSTFMFSAWLSMSVFFYSYDIYDMTYADHNYWPFGSRNAPAGLVIVKDLCLGVVMVTYLVYIGFSARAVDVNKRLKRQSFRQLEDGVDLVPIKNPNVPAAANNTNAV